MRVKEFGDRFRSKRDEWRRIKRQDWGRQNWGTEFNDWRGTKNEETELAGTKCKNVERATELGDRIKGD